MTNLHRFLLWLVLLIEPIAYLSLAHAAGVPPLINYQGTLTDAYGVPIADTTKPMEFNIYDAPTGGNLIWGPQLFATVPVINGRFNVILGTTDSMGRSIANAFNADNRYLGIRAGSLSELVPRQQILSTAYAIQSNIAKTVQGPQLYVHPSTNNVGIKTTNPTVPLEVNGNVKVNGKLTFEGGQGPLCMFFKECPNQWIDKGTGGYIHRGNGCPYGGGGWHDSYWQWCHPRICCDQ